MRKISYLVILLFIFVNINFAISSNLNLKYDKFYTYDEVVAVLKMFKRKYPDKVKIEVIGKSYEKRDIWALTLNNPKTGDAHSKPGYLIDANIHGNEIQGTEVALYIIDYLLSNYGTDKFATTLVDRIAFYFVPVINVDSRYHYLIEANTPSTLRYSYNPIDDDKDGRFDEDPPDDLDKDGNICQMIIKDENGKWKKDKDDPRILVRVKEGEKGEYSFLGMEGIDNDGDGMINEDTYGGYDMNRTYAFNWQPPYVQFGTSDYPLSVENTRVYTEFIKKHPNILFFQDFHNSGGMILRGPGTKDVGEFSYIDKKVYDYLGKEGEKILPGYKYMISWKDLYSVYGGSDDQMHYLFGAFSFVNELYQEQQDFDKDGKVSEKERMKWNDLVLMGKGFVKWHKFKHPKYGEVEIGGWAKLTSRVPPYFQLEELCHRNAAFILFTASHLPEIEIKKYEVKKLGDNLYKLRISVKNKKIVPTRTFSAVQNNIGLPDYIKISGNNIKVIAGGKVFDKYNDKFNKQKKNPNKIEIDFLDGNTTLYFDWIISGKGLVNITYISQKGGHYHKTIRIK